MEYTEHFSCSVNPQAVEEEQKNFLSVITAFKFYRTFSMNRVNKTEKYLNTLPQTHQDMLCRYRDHLNQVRDCIDQNYKIIRKLIKDVGTLFHNENETTKIPPENDYNPKLRHQDFESRLEVFKLLKVQITLKQFARDWSSAGEQERQQCYKPIIDEITKFYNPENFNLNEIKILVPGAGLGRLTYELAYRGYFCEGNEFSLFMLIASNFVLNKCVIDNQYTLYPWVHQFVNNLSRSDQIAQITFPDVSPTQLPPKGVFNMVAGDFLEIYKEYDYWDCVATCFFIDCANNIAEFIENIYNILKPGGIWVNLGPLLYHYSDIPNEGSIEPSYEDLVSIIKNYGFEFLKNETGIQTKYAQNPKSMQQNEYLSVFFVCRKPLVVSANNDDKNNHHHHHHHQNAYAMAGDTI